MVTNILTSRNMLTVCDKMQHLLVHLDELVLRKCLLFFPFFQSLLNLVLEEVRLDCVDHLHKQQVSLKVRGG